MGRLCVQAIGSIQSLCCVLLLSIWSRRYLRISIPPPRIPPPCHSLSDIAKQLAGMRCAHLYAADIIFPKIKSFLSAYQIVSEMLMNNAMTMISFRFWPIRQQINDGYRKIIKKEDRFVLFF